MSGSCLQGVAKNCLSLLVLLSILFVESDKILKRLGIVFRVDSTPFSGSILKLCVWGRHELYINPRCRNTYYLHISYHPHFDTSFKPVHYIESRFECGHLLSIAPVVSVPVRLLLRKLAVVPF